MYGKKAGKEIVLYAMIIYTMLRDSNIPVKVKVVLTAALGYLILPADLVSDMLPIIGFADDIAFLTYVISSASEYITPEIKEKAKDKLGKWYNAEDAEIIDDELQESDR